MTAVYNENDPFAAQWLRELIKTGEITQGDVIETDIRSLHGSDIAQYDQIHLFAGIGVWARAVRDTGLENENLISGSCPCQPFSVGKKGKGKSFEEHTKDERHLWPHMRRVIGEINEARVDPIPIVFGEQVHGSTSGEKWFYQLVQPEMERKGYRCGAISLGSHSVGGAHKRQRLYWSAIHRDMANTGSFGRYERAGKSTDRFIGKTGEDIKSRSEVRDVHSNSSTQTVSKSVADSNGSSNGCSKLQNKSERDTWGQRNRHESDNDSVEHGLQRKSNDSIGHANSGYKWVYCVDDTWRPIPSERAFRPLDDEPTPDLGRVGQIRGYGNAIDLRVATAYLTALKRNLNG